MGWYKLCCDLGYQVDVISGHQIEAGALSAYRVLIVPANDCYGAVEHHKSENAVRSWVREGGILIHGPNDGLARSCFGIAGEPCKKMPYRYGTTVISQGESFCRYRGGSSLADYVDGSCCVAVYEGGDLSAIFTAYTEDVRGAVYSMGVQIGASYAARNIPHVPYEQGNREMYPLIQSGTTLIRDILERYIQPASGIRERGIETGVFENGMIIVNHRSTPYVLPEQYETQIHQYLPAYTQDGRSILAAHAAVFFKTS